MPNIKDKITGLFGAKKEPQKTAAELEVERRIAEKKFQKKMDKASQETQNLCALAAKAEKEGNHPLALQYAKQAMMYKKTMNTVEVSKTISDTTKNIGKMMNDFSEMMKANPVEKLDTGMVAEIVKQQAQLQAANIEQEETLEVLFEALGINEEAEFVGTGDPKAEEFLAKIVSDQTQQAENSEILSDSISQLEEQLKKHS